MVVSFSARREERLERGECRLRIAAADADTEAVARHGAQLGGVDVAGQQHDARRLEEIAAEPARVTLEVAREADAAALRVLERELLAPAGEERVEVREVALDDRAVAGADRSAVAQRDRGQELARPGVADRR